MKKIVTSILLILLCINIFGVAIVAAQTTEKVPVIITFNRKPQATLIKAFGGDIKFEYSLIPAIACSLPTQAIETLRQNPIIKTIEPDIKVHALNLENSWGVDRIDADIVHDYPNTGVGTKVAIIDTGIDDTHEDLVGSVGGWIDYVKGLPSPYDDNGHGTHCSGIVSAAKNGLGVVGVAPNAELFVTKVLDSSGSGSLSAVVAGIQWAVNQGVDVISMSLGADGYTTSLEAACNSAATSGVLLVAAAGNDYRGNKHIEWDTVDYPAKFSSVIAVGATDQNDDKAGFSSSGPALEIAAPGVAILSTVPEGYALYSGTSMACPHVAGVAALIFASPIDLAYDYDGDQEWDAIEVRTKIQDTADYLGNPYWYGKGLVDADEAVPPTGETPNQPPIADAGIDQTVQLDSNGEATVNFDGSNSQDPDGSITTYQWNFGDSNSGTGETTSHTYTSANVYTVLLTVTDNEGSTDTDQITIIVEEYQEPPPETPIHVGEIVMNVVSKAGGRILFASTTITVTDDNGNPVDGALVTGIWTEATSDSDSGITDSTGKITFQSDTLKKPELPQSFTFTVTNLSKNGCIYEEESNTKTWDNISYP